MSTLDGIKDHRNDQYPHEHDTRPIHVAGHYRLGKWPRQEEDQWSEKEQ